MNPPRRSSGPGPQPTCRRSRRFSDKLWRRFSRLPAAVACRGGRRAACSRKAPGELPVHCLKARAKLFFVLEADRLGELLEGRSLRLRSSMARSRRASS